MKAYLSEIFSSIQGEGPYVGERQLFIRFCGCHRSCIFCDTDFEKRPKIAVEKVPGSGKVESIENPISVEKLAEIVEFFTQKLSHRHIAITGGEPLLQVGFLEQFFPLLKRQKKAIYLETTGDLPDELARIVRWVDVVAMDIKLPSVTHEAADFSNHWNFLNIAQQAECDVFVKIVVSAETQEQELLEAAQGVKKVAGPAIEVVLQPMSPSEKCKAVPSGKQLLMWQELLLSELDYVRVIPQTHLMLNVL